MSSREVQVPLGNILETSYGLVEDDKMSSKWRNVQCLLFVISAVSGLVFYCSFSAVRKELSDACIVNVKLVFQRSNPDVIDEISSNWGSPGVCDFCSYTPLTCSVLALVLLVYFIMSGRGGRGTAGFLAQPWRIVMPTILFSLLAFSVVFATTWLTYFGRKDFCKQIEDRNVSFPANMTDEDKKDAEVHIKLITLAGCKPSGNLTILDTTGHSVKPEYFNLLSVVEIAGLIDTTSWCLGFVVVLARFLLMPDFRLLRFDFILESGGKNSSSPRKPSESSGKWSDADPRGSVHSSDSALSTAQTALTSLDQQSLKHRYSNPFAKVPRLHQSYTGTPPSRAEDIRPSSVKELTFPLQSSLQVPRFSHPFWAELFGPRNPSFDAKNENDSLFASRYSMNDRMVRLCW